MAPEDSALAIKSPQALNNPIDPSQTLRATTALTRKIQSDRAFRHTTQQKQNLLADTDEDDGGDEVPIWLILGTKKHIVDQKRLKPGKISLPHPYLDARNENLRICLITTDPQRAYKDLILDPSFPPDLAKRIGRVIGLQKLKAKYSSFESRRQLNSQYDVFLADDRIITYLPQVLGKIFYKSGSKRPIPVSLEGKRQNFDEQGHKRRKLAEGGSKVVKSSVKPTEIAREIERALSSALVHLAPSTTTAVKVGTSTMSPQQIQENVEAVTETLVEKYVPRKWRNVKSVHIKGPDTAALPIWLADELWEDQKDVLEEALPEFQNKKGKKRKRGMLVDAAAVEEEEEVIEVPGGDGKMRRLERPKVVDGLAPAVKSSKQRTAEVQGDAELKAMEKAEKATRKEALLKQKAVARGVSNDTNGARVVENGGDRKERKARLKSTAMI